MERSLRFVLVLVLLICARGELVRAQDPQPATTSPIKSAAASGFVRRHRPGTWSVIGMTTVNSGNTEGEGFLTTFFSPEPGRQYARRMWVPPHARRFSWLPIYVPLELVGKSEQVSLKTAMLDTTSGREVLQRRMGELLTNEVPLSIDHDPVKTALYLRKPTLDEAHEVIDPDRDVANVLRLARESIGLSVTTTEVDADFMPPWADVLRAYDSMILSADRIQYDSAGQSALRGWLRAGGNLWISLDRVSPGTLQMLLGNSLDLQIVDRVELDQYQLVTHETADGVPLKESLEFEQPVELIRVVTSEQGVPFRVQGWPALIRLRYGEGNVFIMTLAPRGWSTEFNPQPTQALRRFAQEFFSVREGRVTPSVFQPALEQRIGYRIPSRSLAVAFLSGYCAALLVAGVFLARAGRLDRLAWVVPVITISAAGVFVVLGWTSSTSVPPTLAYAQIAQFVPQTDEARVDTLAAVYDQQSREVVWRSQDRNWVVPAPADDSNVRRLVWTDLDGMETQNASVKAGSVGLVTASGMQPLAKHVGVLARFGSQGLEGTVATGGLPAWSDPVIVNSGAPSLALAIGGDGRFVAGPEQVLASGQFTAEALLSDEQRRRQDVLRTLLNPEDTLQYPGVPSLLFWTDAMPQRQEFPEGFQLSGAALGVIPIQLQRTPAGEKFRVPSTFLATSVLAGRQGASTAYNPRSGQWVRGLTRPSEVVIRFQLPSEVLPAKAEQGTLTIRGNTPSRTVQLLSFANSEPTVIQEFPNLNGVVTVTLSADHLRLDAEGGVRLGIGVSETPEQRRKREADQARMQNLSANPFAPPPGVETESMTTVDNSTWQIDYVRLSVDGETRALGQP